MPRETAGAGRRFPIVYIGSCALPVADIIMLMVLRPNPPKMVTVLIALALLAVGVAGTLIDPDTVRDIITGLSLPRGIERDILGLVADQTIAYVFLLASPVLLIIGSLLPGI